MFVFMYVYVSNVCCAHARPEKGIESPGTTITVLSCLVAPGTKLGSSGRAASVLNH